jgi:CBS domain containing-hemolysin-like protein
MHIMQTVLAGPVWLLNGTGAVLLRLFRIPPVQGEERLHTPEELEMIVQESAQGGLLYPSEETIIRNILDFAGREVHQVMTPRPKVQAIPVDMPLPDMLEIVTISNFSRFPVYETNLDQIIGIIHIKDLVRQVLRPTDNFDIRLLLRPVHLVPEHYSVDKLLTTFKRRHHHMAIALDEFGGTAGIVTLEDLVEEVVGEVRDEFDLENEPLIKLGPGKLEVAGDFLLDDLADYVNLGKEENLPLHVETVGGLIMAKLGRIPQTGDTVTLENQVTLQTLSVTGLAVDRAQVNFSEPLQNSEE